MKSKKRNIILSGLLSLSLVFSPCVSAQRNTRNTSGNSRVSTTGTSTNNHRSTTTTTTTNPGSNTTTKPSTPSGNSNNSNNNKPANNSNNTKPSNNSKPANNTTPSTPTTTKPANPIYKPSGNTKTPKPKSGSVVKPVSNPAPVVNIKPRPTAPVRYTVVRNNVPNINAILGITFGTLITAGINSLFNSGYTVSSYDNETIYMQDVQQFGITWPTAALYYGINGLESSQFQYVGNTPSNSVFQTAYNNICASYGSPISSTVNYNTASATWWSGNVQAYITLDYGPSVNTYGVTQYYTNLVISQ